MAEGTIKKLTDRGFGFIKTAGTKDLFFHSSAVEGVTFEELREGQKVSYTEGQGPKGPCAENVTPLSSIPPFASPRPNSTSIILMLSLAPHDSEPCHASYVPRPSGVDRPRL